MKYIKVLLYSFLMLVCSYGITSTTVQAVVSGNTTEPASQLVMYYNNSGSGDESTILQITNTSFSEGVILHVQILDEVCDEVNYFDELTLADTLTIDVLAETGGAFQSGIVVINAVAAVNDFDPVSFPHLIGTTWIIDDDGENFDNLSNANAVGRDLVAGAFETIQPEDVWAPFHVFDFEFSNELIAAAWTDSYDGGYIAESGSAETTAAPIGLFIIDDEEVKDSCGDFAVECLFEGPFTTFFDADFGEYLDPITYVCDKNSNSAGIAQMLEFAYSSTSANLITLTRGEGELQFNESGGMDYAIHIGQAVEPPVDCEAIDPCTDLVNCEAECQAIECTELEDCEDPEKLALCDGVEVVPGAVCQGGLPVETICTDMIDNNENGQVDCDDAACAANTTICPPSGGGGGGGGGCSVVAANSVGLANALLLLIPALGIAIRRRLIG